MLIVRDHPGAAASKGWPPRRLPSGSISDRTARGAPRHESALTSSGPTGSFVRTGG